MAEGGVSTIISIGADFIDTVVVHNILNCLVIMSNEDQGRPSTTDLRSKKEGSQPEKKKENV